MPTDSWVDWYRKEVVINKRLIKALTKYHLQTTPFNRVAFETMTLLPSKHTPSECKQASRVWSTHLMTCLRLSVQRRDDITVSDASNWTTPSVDTMSSVIQLTSSLDPRKKNFAEHIRKAGQKTAISKTHSVCAVQNFGWQRQKQSYNDT